MTRGAKIGLWSGVGLVMSDMIGSGVLLSAGFMAMDLAPGHILLAWVVGGVVALCGARAYAAIAAAIPRSGGEYRYLSSLLHPSLGYLAGWTSLLVGFSLPIAVAGLAAGAFAQTIAPGLDARLVAAAIIVAIAAVHASGLRTSRLAQDALAVIKLVLLVGFVVLGLTLGSNAWPTWAPEAAKDGLPVRAFFISLVYIAYAYSGWNASIYNAEEFEHPRRDVPRAMMIGCALVMVGYLLVNWVIVANLTQADFGGWISGDTKRITLGHLVTRKLVGETAAKLFSLLVVVWLASAVSAMGMIGPRVFAAMSRDGYLPRPLAGQEGRPPVFSVLVQAAIALAIVFTEGFLQALERVGAILTLMAVLTVLGVFRLRFDPARGEERPGVLPLACATVFVAMSGWSLYFVISKSPRTLIWIAGLVVVSAIGYLATRLARPGGPEAPSARRAA